MALNCMHTTARWNLKIAIFGEDYSSERIKEDKYLIRQSTESSMISHFSYYHGCHECVKRQMTTCEIRKKNFI